MLPNAKRPALAMLVGALWLTAAAPAWAQNDLEKRAQFVSFLSQRQSHAILTQLNSRFTQLTDRISTLNQQLTNVTSKLKNPPAPPVLVRLATIDQQLQQQSARILQRLQQLNSTPSAQSTTALGRLRHELTRQEAQISHRQKVVQRLERAAATPSAPGGS
jgi:hypothetical protein